MERTDTRTAVRTLDAIATESLRFAWAVRNDPDIRIRTVARANIRRALELLGRPRRTR